jgi:hypothetical protein
MPAAKVNWLSFLVGSTPKAELGTKVLGGSNDATCGADGVLLADFSPPWAPASELVSSPPPQPDRRTRAVAAVATALAVGRSIVGYSPEVRPGMIA